MHDNKIYVYFVDVRGESVRLGSNCERATGVATYLWTLVVEIKFSRPMPDRSAVQLSPSNVQHIYNTTNPATIVRIDEK